MVDRDVFAIVMAGGSGTRFWPASRHSKPKQFLAIAADEPLIVATVARLEGLVPIERVLVVTAAEHVERVSEALPDLPPENVLAEPVGRNTLPCVALAAFEVERRCADSVQVVLPADHVIRPPEAFRASLAAAVCAARESGALVTLGIRPTFPATGYGYVEAGALETGLQSPTPVHRVERFVEKPPLERAREFLSTGRFYWNSGMFVWRTDAILAALREHAPALHAALHQARLDALTDVYAGLPSISVDVGVMEKAQRVLMLPVDYEWDDVGSWTALADVLPDVGDGHRVAGGARLVSEDSSGCIVYGEGDGVTALVGVRDLVVVHAGGATLVCPKDRAQDVRRVVEALRSIDPSKL